MQKIIFNGKSYASPAEMPPEVRQAYQQAMNVLADKDQNGVPDILEGAIGIGSAILGSTQFIVDGKVYSSVDELPPEARRKYEQAMAKVGGAMGDADQDGEPDILEATFSTPLNSSTPIATPAHSRLDSSPSVVSEVRPNYRALLFAAIVIALLALVACGVFVVLPLLK